GPFGADAQRPEVVLWLELKRETQLPSRLVLCVIVREDKVARQVEVKILARAPIVDIPLDKKPVRLPVSLEYAPVWPSVPVEVEKCLAAVGEIEATLVQISAAQEFREFLARMTRIKHRLAPPVSCADRPWRARSCSFGQSGDLLLDQSIAGLGPELR